MTVAAIIREQEHRYIPAADWVLFAGDLLVLQGDPVELKPVVDQARLELLGAAEAAERKPRDRNDELEAVEAVVSADSPLVGRTPEELRLRQRYEVNLLALSRGGARLTTRLRQNRFRAGDVVVLQGRRNRLAETLARLGCLPLAERNLAIGRPRPRLTGADYPGGGARPDYRAAGVGGARLLHGRGAGGAARRDLAQGGLRFRGVADRGDARLPHPGRRGAEGDRRRGADRRRAHPCRRASVGHAGGGIGAGRVDAGDTAAAPRGGGAGDGAGGGGGGEKSRASGWTRS